MGRREHDRFLQAVAGDLGIAWQKYRRRQSRRGLLRRLRASNLESLEAYRGWLDHDPHEARRLIAAMRVTVSRFYRDPQVWRDLAGHVLPRLVAHLPAAVPLRAWSVGCASGEEPYTLSMVWERLTPPRGGRPTLQVLATDLDERVVARAQAGLYGAPSLADLPQGWQGEFFDSRGDALRIAEKVRSRVRFTVADLDHDPPPKGQHLVLCRYLIFTYYRGFRLGQALESLLSALAPGGALVVGEKEHSFLEGMPAAENPLAAGVLEPWPGTVAVYRRGEPSDHRSRF